MPWRGCLQGEEEEILVGIGRLSRHKPVRQQVLRGVAGISSRGVPKGYQAVPASLARPCNTDVTHRSSPSPTKMSL